MRLMRWLSQRAPTLDGDRLYAFTAMGRLVCLATDDGREHWHRSYASDFASGNRRWGFCDYPLVDGAALICLPLGSKAGIVALNKFDGELIWQRTFEEQVREVYAAMILVKMAGTKQYVAAMGESITGLSANDGATLWQHVGPRGRFGITHTPIMLDDGSIFCSNGNGVTGIVTNREGGVWEVRPKYAQQVRLDDFQDGALAVANNVFAPSSTAGTLVCFDGRTGESVWTASPLEKADRREAQSGRGPPQSGGRRSRTRLSRVGLTFADGHLYCLHANGTVRLVKAVPAEYLERSSFSIPDYRPGSGATLPVVTAGRLYIRDDDRLLCFDVRRGAKDVATHDPARIVLSKPERPADSSKLKELRPIFVATPKAVVDKMLEVAQVSRNSIVVDLGSGDGRIVIAAAKKYGCRAVGYEIDRDLVRESRAKVEDEAMSEQVTIRDQDMCTADLCDADVVTVYLDPRVLERMKPQFAQMKKGSRIVSHFFEIPGLKPERRFIAESDSGEGHEILLYVTPLTDDENPSNRR